MFLSYNFFILEFNPKFNVSFSELLNNLFIYSIYNKVSGVINANNYINTFFLIPVISIPDG